MAKIKISPEYSAISSVATPNPLLKVSIKYILLNENAGKLKSLKIADYGCGKLRHLHMFLDYFNPIYLVDTQFQLSRMLKLFVEKTKIKKYINELKTSKKLIALKDSEFESSRLGLDLIFSIAVFDVVLSKTRSTMIKTAYRNLKQGGFFIIIIPRNDSSFLRRCSQENKYYDGYFFNHHGITTFFKNFRETKYLINRVNKNGFMLKNDLSKYRNVCLIFRKK